MGEIRRPTFIVAIILSICESHSALASNVVSLLVGENRFLLENWYTIDVGDIIAIFTGVTVGLIVLFVMLTVITMDHKTRRTAAELKSPQKGLPVNIVEVCVYKFKLILILDLHHLIATCINWFNIVLQLLIIDATAGSCAKGH